MIHGAGCCLRNIASKMYNWMVAHKNASQSSDYKVWQLKMRGSASQIRSIKYFTERGQSYNLANSIDQYWKAVQLWTRRDEQKIPTNFPYKVGIDRSSLSFPLADDFQWSSLLTYLISQRMRDLRAPLIQTQHVLKRNYKVTEKLSTNNVGLRCFRLLLTTTILGLFQSIFPRWKPWKTREKRQRLVVNRKPMSRYRLVISLQKLRYYQYSIHGLSTVTHLSYLTLEVDHENITIRAVKNPQMLLSNSYSNSVLGVKWAIVVWKQLKLGTYCRHGLHVSLA